MLKNKLIYLAVLIFSFFLIKSVNAQTFTDVYPTHPYYNAIESLAEQGILTGYPDQTFKPDNAINRAELLKVFLLSSEIEVEESTYNAGFPDVISNSWYAKYIVKAKENGIVQGNPDGYFYPDKQVNFAEALKMLILANNIEIETDLTEDPFADVPQDAWFAPYFEYAKSINLIKKTSAENALPEKPLDRGEVAQLIFLFQEAKDTATTTTEEQFATYYSDDLEGNNTASGEVFDQSKFTAAHKTLAFGTQVKVTNLENDESVIVTINDRGPYSSNENYVLDLSKAAFQAISPLSRGVIKIKYEVVEEGEEEETTASITCPTEIDKNPIVADFFENLTLTKDVPNLFQKNEVYNFVGSLTDNNSDVATVFLINAEDEDDEFRFTGEILDGKFNIPVLFSQTGTFNLGILRGTSGQSYITEIRVVSNQCLSDFTENSTVEPDNLKIAYVDDTSLISWDNHAQKLSKIKIQQGKNQKEYLVNNAQTSFTIPYADFADFSQGEVTFTISSANSDSIFSLDQSSAWVESAEQTFNAVKHHQIFNESDEIETANFVQDYDFGASIVLSGKSSKTLMANASIILPSGTITELLLTADNYENNALGTKVIPAKNAFQLNYTPEIQGTYLVEINKDDGFALINMPIYETETIPLIPDLWDTTAHLLSEETKNLELEEMRLELFNAMNTSRQEFGADNLITETSLNELAQSRAEDMAENDYLSHQNLDGKYISDLKTNYGIKSNVSENISKDTNIAFTHAGLMRSAIHRNNILNQNWTSVGLGIAVDEEGYLYTAEVFAEDELSEKDLPNLRSQILETINLKRSEDLLSDTILNEVAQNWSENILNRSEVWFEDPDTGISLSYLINSEIEENKQTASTILKGSFDPILEEIDDNDTVIDEDWKKLGIGISQNDDGSLNVTMVYSN